LDIAELVVQTKFWIYKKTLSNKLGVKKSSPTPRVVLLHLDLDSINVSTNSAAAILWLCGGSIGWDALSNIC
jgi:hypothetical protein